MSHIVKSKVEMKNQGALAKAIKHLGLEDLGNKRHSLYSGQSAVGIGLRLPGWSYPIVIDPVKGEAVYDNYGGHWGKQIELDKLVQRYVQEVTIEEAVAGGYNYNETVLANGDIELELEALVTT